MKVDIFDVDYDNRNTVREKYLEPLHRSKFAGWFDLYNKAFYENLCPVQENWKGYGPWDHYSMIITDYCKNQQIDFQQYVLRGETIWMYPSGPLLENNADGFKKYYSDRLKTNDVPNQRQQFESNFQLYLNKGIQKLKEKGIL